MSSTDSVAAARCDRMGPASGLGATARALCTVLLWLVAPSTAALAQTPAAPHMLAPGETPSGSGGGGAACGNGQDDDGDGVADYPGDAGCSGPSDTSEGGDGLVVVSSTTTATALAASINAQPAGPVTVRTDGPLRTLTGDFKPPRTNVSLNFLSVAGSLDLNVNSSRFVHGSIVATDVDGAKKGILINLGETAPVSDVVIDSSLIDGGNAGGGLCWETQIILYDSVRTRITNNTVQNICPHVSSDHSEAFYLQDGNQDVLIQGNTFTHNGSTAHIFFTCYTGGGSCQGSRQICVTGNTFNATWGNIYDIQHYPSLSTSTINVDGGGAQAGVASTFPTRSCAQCLDGIDNDGDGLTDLWDPQCTGGGDTSESQ